MIAMLALVGWLLAILSGIPFVVGLVLGILIGRKL